MRLEHELWKYLDPETGCIEFSFFLSRNRAHQQMEANAEMIWTVEADSHAEAMTLYHEFMNLEPYRAMSKSDWEPYS